MNFKKRIILTVILLMIISLLIGCSNDITNSIYDNNAKIAKSYDSFGLDDSKETIESGVYTGKLKLSGCGTIWRYESDSDFNLEAPCKLSVKSGKAKIVLISPDDTVTNLVEISNKDTTDENTTLTLPIKKGINRIKIVGYDKADINIELNITKGDFQ
ncbi:lipoprotein [Clostridium sp. CTA-7]